MKQLAWKWNRLRAMSLTEVAHRVQDVVHIKAQTLGFGLAQPTPPNLDVYYGQGSPHTLCAPWVTPLPQGVDKARHIDAAERILAGRFDVFALHDVALGFPPEFNRDPKSGIVAPLEFGKSINYRDEALVGDIKYLWEPNRHLALTTLAQAWHLTNDLRYAQGVQQMLTAWLDQCPYPHGVNWVSSLELAIRLLNWSVTWHLLGGIHSPLFVGDDGQAFLHRWLTSVYQHCHFIIGYESRDSSANNHLLGELIGLFVAAVTWPCWEESAHWQHHAAYELEQQAFKQNGPDGVNLEQAIYYQHEVCDMMLFAVLLGRTNGCPFSTRFSARLEQMLVFVAAMMDKSGHVPAIGDADDALLVGWNQAADWNLYRSLLATGAVLFERGDFKRKAGAFDDKSCWLLGDAARQQFEQLPLPAELSLPQAFTQGGYYILGSDWGSDKEVHIVADCGPLGYLSIAAHGHADALAMTLSVGGHLILIDPGTFSYHTQQVWRDYFRGTSAHNTVRVDGLDQSDAAGNFLWLRKARSHCEYWRSQADVDTWVACHDGYMHLPDHVLHRRKIEYNKQQREILVEDSFQCHGPHELEWHWHFAPECEVTLVSGQLLHIRSGEVKLEMALPIATGEPELVRGRDTPPLGWDAPSFDQKVPTTTLVWREAVHDSVARKIVFRIL